MVRLVLAAFIAATALVGCGSSQVAVTESAPDKAAIAESKAAWTPDKVEAFKKAHAEEGRLTPGEKMAKNITSDQAKK